MFMIIFQNLATIVPWEETITPRTMVDLMLAFYDTYHEKSNFIANSMFKL